MDRYELAHQMDLLPLVVVLVLHRMGRELPREAWLLGFAWFVAWVGSSLGHLTGGEWWTSYLWLPLQFTLVLWAVLPEGWTRETLVGCIVAAVLSAQLSAHGPDVLMTVLGSIIALLFVRGWVTVPVMLYFGAGSAAYLLMASAPESTIQDAWDRYQIVRAVAYVAFVALLLAPRWRERWSV